MACAKHHRPLHSKNVSRLSLAGLIVFVTLFLTVDMISSASRFDAPGFTFSVYGLQDSRRYTTMIPVACLLGTIFTLSSLSKSNELLRFFSSGMSLARVATPILVLVVIVSVFSFWLGDRILRL